MDATFRDVVVVGGGISGLTAAWHLKKAGIDVCLLEADTGVGGSIRTERRDGFLLEKGPFNVIVRDPAFEALLDDLSDEVKVITASRAARIRYIYRRGRLHALPTNPVSLATTRLLSVGARFRLLAGLIVSRRCAGGARKNSRTSEGLTDRTVGPTEMREETIEQAAVRRFGREVADTIVSAAISGILAGDIRRLSLPACFPGVARIDSQASSLIGYGLKSLLRRARGLSNDEGRISNGGPCSRHSPLDNRRSTRWRGLVSLDGGLGALTESLARRLGADLLSGCRVEEIRWNAECRMWNVDCRVSNGVPSNRHSSLDNRSGGTAGLRCRRLLMAAPAVEAGRLLQPLVPEIDAATASIQNASLVVLNVGFRRSDVGHPLQGFGFLVPQNEPDFPLMGVLWADSIFPHHAPPDRRLIRVFIGGTRDPGAVNRTDDELLATAMEALRDLLQLSGRIGPQGGPYKGLALVDVCRYQSAIPQYHLGHTEKVARLRAAVAAQPGLYVIGNYLEGVSINDCVRLATSVAEEIVEATAG